MPFFLPLIALVLVALAIFGPSGGPPRATNVNRWRLGEFIVAWCVAGVLGSKYGPHGEFSMLFSGLSAGLIITMSASMFGDRSTERGAARSSARSTELLDDDDKPGGRRHPFASLRAGSSVGYRTRETSLPAFGVGLIAATALHVAPTPMQAAVGLGVLVGVGLGALIFASESATCAAVAATVVVAADYLCGRHSPSPAAAYLGSAAGLLALAGGVAAAWLPRKLGFLRGVLVGAVILGGGLAVTASISDRYLLVTLAIGLGAGLAIDWLLADENADAVKIGLAAIIGVGVATLAFGLARGAGMSIALAAAVGLLAAVGNRSGILALGPLLGLVMFRMLSEAHPAASHALDIGQHYALLGLILGAILPLLPTDWLKRDGLKGAIGALLWIALPLGLPPLTLLMFGDKGVIGFVVGLGFSGICESLRKGQSLLPVALAGAMGATTILSMNWMTGLADMGRNDKIHVFEMASIALVVLAGVLAFLSRETKSDLEASK